MVGTGIKRLFGILAGRNRQVPLVRYSVTDPAIAEGLRRWMDDHSKAAAAIDAHLKNIMPLQMRINDLHYMTDLDGRLSAITVCGPVPHGWTGMGIQHVSLLWPESEEAVAALDNLPKSSRRDLNAMIGWPTFEDDFVSHKYPDLARLFNHAVRVEEQNGQVFIAVPDHAFTKASCPYIHAEIERWTQVQQISGNYSSPSI